MSEDYKNELLEALRPFARYLDVLESMGGSIPRSGTYLSIESHISGVAEITIEDMARARSLVARATGEAQ